jgi:hypothetical protein
MDVKDLMSLKKYDKAISILDSIQPDNNMPDLSNYLYLLGYYGKHDYHKSYEHYLKIVKKNRYIPTEVYVPEIKMKIGLIDLRLAKAQIDSVLTHYNNYSISVLISLFYTKYNFLEDADKIINRILKEDTCDLYFHSLKLFVTLKNGNINDFLNSWLKLESSKDQYFLYCHFEYPLLIDEIYSEINKHDSITLSLFYYIEEDYINSENLFKGYIENHKISNKTDLIDSLRMNYPENLIALLNEMYYKFISE